MFRHCRLNDDDEADRGCRCYMRFLEICTNTKCFSRSIVCQSKFTNVNSFTKLGIFLKLWNLKKKSCSQVTSRLHILFNQRDVVCSYCVVLVISVTKGHINLTTMPTQDSSNFMQIVQSVRELSWFAHQGSWYQFLSCARMFWLPGTTQWALALLIYNSLPLFMLLPLTVPSTLVALCTTGHFSHGLNLFHYTIYLERF